LLLSVYVNIVPHLYYLVKPTASVAAMLGFYVRMLEKLRKI